MSVTTVINGKSYWTTTPIPDDRGDAPPVVDWRGYRLTRQPVVSYGTFGGWWNIAECGRLKFMVDGGHAHVALVDDEDNSVIGCTWKDGKDESDALDRSAAMMEAELNELRYALDDWKAAPVT